MSTFTIKQFTSILQDMISWIIANQDKVTDFNEGSVIRSFCEAIALEVEQLYIRTRVGFDEAMKDIPFYTFNFTRFVGLYSSGSVIFSRSGTTGDITIPIGTLISTADGIQFATTSVGTIANGNQDSNTVTILASEIGAESNVPADTIIVIVTPVTGVETVTNASGTSGGSDDESDEDFLARFQDFIEGLGESNIYGLVTGAKTVDGVRSASVFEHFPPSSSYNASVYIDDGAGNAPQALIDEVESILIGDGTAGNSGYKAAGINIQILAPTKVTQAVTVEITDSGELAQTTVEYNVEQVITNYINNLVLGEDIIRNRIIEVIMAVDGVDDLSLTTPATNITINASQIARVGTITITFA